MWHDENCGFFKRHATTKLLCRRNVKNSTRPRITWIQWRCVSCCSLKLSKLPHSNWRRSNPQCIKELKKTATRKPQLHHMCTVKGASFRYHRYWDLCMILLQLKFTLCLNLMHWKIKSRHLSVSRGWNANLWYWVISISRGGVSGYPIYQKSHKRSSMDTSHDKDGRVP